MQKYGLIGYPLKHSFSIGYFNEKFRSEGVDAEYVNFEIPSMKSRVRATNRRKTASATYYSSNPKTKTDTICSAS